MATAQEIIDAIEDLRRQRSAITVGISGFCGAGKSTLTRHLVDSVTDSARIRGDDFLDPERSHQRSADWDGVDRSRLRSEVLEPFRSGKPGLFRRYDWGTRQLGSPEAIPPAQVLVVDAIGLFHPELDGMFDLTVWVDVDLSLATERGMARDRRLGRTHEQLWNDVSVPNERDFVTRFNPRARADCLYTAD